MTYEPVEQHEYDFDLAVSFAGENRADVEAFVRALDLPVERVFYDEDYAIDIWGEDLVEYLADVYMRRARFVIMFISRAYRDKSWPTHERRFALARAIDQRTAYILPVRLDDTELPGLRPTIAYLDFRRVGISGLVAAARTKLETAIREQGGKTIPPPAVRRVPRNQEEIQRLLEQRPPLWEYLLYAATLLQGASRLESKYRDHEIGFARMSGNHVDIADLPGVLRTAQSRMLGTIENFNAVLEHNAQKAAFGTSGTPGDPERIVHIADRAVSVYEDLLDTAAWLRSLPVTEESARRNLRVLARSLDQPIGSTRAFLNGYAREANRSAEQVERNRLPSTAKMTMTYDISSSNSVAKEFDRAIAEAERDARRRR